LKPAAAKQMLAKIMADFPGTQAAEDASSLLENLE